MINNNFEKTALVLAINIACFYTASAQAADSDLPATTIPNIQLTIQSTMDSEQVDGIAPSNIVSTGFDESILESTQSVSVVGQQEMEAIGAETLDEALGYTTGYNRSEPSDKTFASNIVRGFRNLNLNRDGQKYQANIFDGQQEIYGLERIEVVKGASSVLNGAIAPGGVVNAITKKPFFRDAYELNAEVGSFDHKKISTDMNKQLTDDLAVRFVGVYKDSDTFVDEVNDDITYIAPSLTWLATDDTEVTLQADYQNTQTKYVYGLPLEGTIKPSPNGKIDQETFFGIPDYSNYDNDRYTLGYQISHSVSPDLEINHSLRKMSVDLDFTETRPQRTIDPDKRVYALAAFRRDESSDVINAALSANYKWSINPAINNETVLGIDYYDAEHETERYYGLGGTLDVFNPDYKAANTVGEVNTPHKNASWIDDIEQTGVYLRNKMTFNDQLVVTGGVRYDDADASRTDYFEPKDKQEGDASQTTFSLGGVYLMDNDIAPYASYSQSFEVQLGKDRNGNNFDPTEGEQFEVGIRYQPEGSDTLLTGSVYRIEQSNVLVDDANNTGTERFQVQLGEVRSQGVELEAKTQIGENANLIAGYSYTDARTTKASPLNPEDEGARTANVPYNAFSLWGDYRFADFGLPQLKAGVGVRYTGETKARSFDAYAPSYTLVDMMTSYDWSDNLQLSLNVRNLLDEEYLHCTYGCFYGEPRSVVGKVTYKW